MFRQLVLPIFLKVCGGYFGGVTPVPIPNTEVKPTRADGTAREAVWESRSLPHFFRKPAPTGGLFFLGSAVRGAPSRGLRARLRASWRPRTGVRMSSVMVGVIGGTGLGEALGGLGAGRAARGRDALRPALRARSRSPRSAASRSALLSRHGEGHIRNPSHGPVPRQHLGAEVARRHPHPRQRRGRQPSRGGRAEDTSSSRTRSSTDLPAGGHLLRRARRPRRARGALLHERSATCS